MSTSVSVDTSEVKALFAEINARMTSYQSVWGQAKQYLSAAHSANFASSGLPVGGWAPLQPETAAWKAGEGFPPVPLIRTGELFRSVAAASGPPNEMRPKSMQFGTSVDYAKFHQYGAPRANLPKRQIIFEPPGFAQMLAESVADHIKPSGAASATSALRSLFR
jgi:phage gpG-like protein